MKHRSTLGRDLLIGSVFLGALAIFGWSTLSVVSVNVFGLSRTIEVPFTEVHGVREGDDVRLHGLTVGIVTEVIPQFNNPTHKLRVKCRINAKDEVSLPQDSRFVVRSSGPLGGRYIAIIPGTSAKSHPIEEGSFTGKAEQDLFEALSTFVDEIREGKGLLHQLIHNQAVGEDFATIVAGIKESVESVNRGEGVLGALIKNKDLQQRAEKLVANLEAFSTTLQEGDGTIPMLLKDAETRDRVQSLISQLELVATNLAEGKGTLGRFLTDDKVYRDLEESVAGIKQFINDMNDSDGALRMFATDVEFKNFLKDGFIAISDTFSAIRDGKGTVGQLVMNSEAYDSIMRILDNLGDAIEDFREQAPISSFVNVLFAGF